MQVTHKKYEKAIGEYADKHVKDMMQGV